MVSKQTKISVLLIYGGTIECDKPNCNASLSLSVNLCEEMLAIASLESKGNTQFLVRALSFFMCQMIFFELFSFFHVRNLYAFERK